MGKYGPGKRRIMRSFRLDKISLVDVPAQTGADVVILKRGAVAKALPKPKEGEAKAAFVSRFMGDATVRSDYPDQKQRAAVAYSQWQKAHGSGKPSAKARFVVMTSSVNGHAHLVTEWQYRGDTAAWAGTTSYARTKGADTDHTHPWMLKDDGTLEVGESDGHTHDVDSEDMLTAITRFAQQAMREQAEYEARQAAEIAAKRADVEKGESAAQGADETDAVESIDGEEQAMADVPAAVKAASGDDNRVATLEKKLARAEAFGQLNDAGKAFAKGLSETERNAFLDLDAAGRNAAVAKAGEADPVIYKAASGREYRRSQAELAEMAKSLDDQAKIVKAERERREAVELAKRAEDEIPHLPGDVIVKSALLRAVDGIENEEVRKGAHAALVAGNTAIGGAFVRKGTRGSASEQGVTAAPGDNPEAKLDALAKKRAETGNLTFAKAYREVLGTAEGAALYAELVGGEV